MATNGRDRILIVESDPIVSDLIARQALKAAGYQTYVVGDAGSAISKAIQLAPDVIITDLTLPGLSGKDLMVALASQNLTIPVIILSQKGAEADIISAFRLGASDYLIWPVREAEVVNVIERVLRQVRERRERDQLARQLQQANQDLQLRVRELTTIFSIGKAVTSVTDQASLFDKILEGAVKATQADLGWFLLRDDDKVFRLVAQRNLPAVMMARLNQPWDDSISSLVAMSGEPLAIHGEPLKRFKIVSLGQSALIIPIKVQKQVIGLLVVMRQQALPFGASEQNLMGAVADYASISLVNARLFQAMEQRTHTLQRHVDNAYTREKISEEILQCSRNSLRANLDAAQTALDRLVKDPGARWTADQRQALALLQDQLRGQGRIVEAIPEPGSDKQDGVHTVKLNDVIRKVLNHFQHFAQQNNVTLVVDIPQEPLMVQGDAYQLEQVLGGLLSNAIQYSNIAGRVTVRVDRTSQSSVHLTVMDTGIGIDPRRLPKLFEPGGRAEMLRLRRFGGLGIGLPLTKEIVQNCKGKIWAESKPGQGAVFHVTLPLVNSQKS